MAGLFTIPQAAYGRGGGSFTEPNSMMLFGDPPLLVTPKGYIKVEYPPGWIGQYASPLPALSPTGDQIAESLKFSDGLGYGGCDPTLHTCAKITPKYKSVMGVYSLRDKAWKFYGDFCLVGSAAFSPDGNKIAFMGKERLGNPDCGYVYGSDLLQILDIESGQLTSVPETKSMLNIEQLSWAPDGRRIAIGLKDFIVAIEIGSWVQKVITEGTNPSWSPEGNWIVYHINDEQTCMIIRPDGTGAKVVLDLRLRSGGWLFYDGSVWSPDEERLLLNEEAMDGVDSNVTMVDLTTGKVTTESKEGLPVFGWVAENK
jgi:hypothetical protein